MELHPAPRVRRAPDGEQDAAEALCERYLDRLPLSPHERSAFAWRVAHGAPHAAFTALHCALAGRPAPRAMHAHVAHASVEARLQLAYRPPHTALQPDTLEWAAGGQGRRMPLPFAPPVNRASMVPQPWGALNPLARWLQAVVQRRHARRTSQGDGAALSQPPRADGAAEGVDAPDPQGVWQHRGNIRRGVLLSLMLAQTGIAAYFMREVLPYQGTTLAEASMLALFALLFCWVSAGFWTALAGFMVLVRGSDRHLISRMRDERAPIDSRARTAIVMPICNEDVGRVMAGLRATYESLQRSGALPHFDFFVLSDSGNSDIRAAELAAWASLCRAVDGFGRIFYRHRKRRVKRKSGNIDDFCRRWGRNYRYMIVLDADSVMSGACLTTLVRLMEANPGAGIIQTAPRAAGRDTLYARIQQFATRLYGPLFTAGLHYWQLGESHYWGHNAIIRVAPFMRHCALAPLPGRGALAGDILSHDFVEAALMRRAGWGVWIAYDLDGSYEEMPPNLLDELKRDRRWCHGNLMNFRLFAARGMHPVHRAVFVTGVMAYLSAPLWFLFLALSTGLLALHTLVEPQYFVEPRQLFPIWPQWHPEKALALFSATATLLFLPKILSVLLACRGGAREFGGWSRVMASALLEMLVSMLMAPVRMLFHTRFVAAAFLGWALHWKSPPRADSETSWREAFGKHGLHTLLGLAWGGTVYWLNPSFLPWLLPIAGALALSAPLSVWSSRVSLGRRLRRAGLFVIPEECAPPPELQACDAHQRASGEQPGFIDAVVDPVVNALACAAATARIGLPPASSAARDALAQTALRAGPAALDEKQRATLLDDPLLLSQLHFDVWTCAHAHESYRIAREKS
ncbi:glucans biosynthesis glucosyltransferase MdoH [Noviherbaspirillum autotrophicum]|uniref:Glucans biosynthesis glucosyltransferase H n=1 Tax=Noviherbaspirillum autotrophicum TaxID=709839 RepID=A0A0C2BPG3_9BURK|nr:glucans biosynthesis glucosyltransferase MdoH [Noviherbaspirillum autotrophicum]KIF83190.1 glucosyltransferase MdoH [Noviherbaspirillum autotrophicum]